MVLPGHPFDVENITGAFFPHALEAGIGKVEQGLLEDPLQGPMVCKHGKVLEALQIEGALLNRPYDGQAFQLDGSVALLSWSQRLIPRAEERKGAVAGRLG